MLKEKQFKEGDSSKEKESLRVRDMRNILVVSIFLISPAR
jgi:hypothetical protein